MTGRPHPRASVHKVLNNNLVITVDPSGEERVLMGRGIGFHLSRNDPIDMELVDKVYVLDSQADRTRIGQISADVPFAVIAAVTDAVASAASRLGSSIDRRPPLALIDHVQFVIERLEQGIRIPVSAMPELTVLYPDEAAAAEEMRLAISTALEVALPPEETLFIALHLLNATRDESHGSAAELFRHVRHILTIVELGLGVPIEPTSAEAARFILHVKFLLQRLGAGTQLVSDDPGFFTYASSAYPRAGGIAADVAAYLAAAASATVTDEERLYLIVHIERLASRVA